MTSMKDDKEYREQIRLKAKNDQQIDLTEDQVDMCIITEEQEKLSYFHGHLYINPRRTKIDGKWVNKIQWAKTIDGYRVLARRNGLCRVEEPIWQHDGDGNLFACKVSVWRRGPDGYPEGPFVGVAHYHEFAQFVDEVENGRKTGKKIPNRQWRTSPMNQLAVCAERQAHRKAGLDHTHISEEIVDVQPRETVDDDAPDVGGTEPEVQTEAKNEKVGIDYSEVKIGASIRGAMIVNIVGNDPKEHVVLLDNGRQVIFKREGLTLYLEDVVDRTDETPGGRLWKEGDSYYDGTEIINVITKGQIAVLELKSGFKVKLDRWGKEIGRKELEKPQEAPKGETPHEGPRDGPKGDTDFAKAMLLAEDCTSASMEDLRKHTLTLLAFWCKTYNNGVKISPKTAYIELVGVAIADGDKMREEDYRALLETLAEKIKEKAA